MEKQGGVTADVRVATDAESLTAEEKARKAESEAMDRAYHTGHDNWGPCCWNCEYHGQAYKPCDVCTEWRRALR